MDVRKELDFQFLDLHDLGDSDKNQLMAILKSSNVTDALKLPWDTLENNHEGNSTVTEMSELQNHWYQNAGGTEEEGFLKCANPTNVAASSMVMSAIPQTHHPYNQQIITTMCSDWQPMYNVPTDAHIQSYIPGLAYSHPIFPNTGNEIHDVSYGRENGRRSRGRGIRRDNFSRGINQTTEIHSGYIGEQSQFHPPIPVMYFLSDHAVSPQQHQVAGPIFYPPIYSSPTMHPHTNTHPHAHPTYQSHHHSSNNIRYGRQSQSVITQQSQECLKATTTSAAKTQDKRPQNVYSTVKPSSSYHQLSNEEDSNSPQTNIVTTVIVNNSNRESRIDNDDDEGGGTTAVKKSANNNAKVSPVNVKIEHNIVSTVNEACNGTEKSDLPCVNINSSIEVKQNGESEKEYKNETVSSIKTTVVKTLSTSTSKSGESEVQIEENDPSKGASLTDEPLVKPNNTVIPAVVSTVGSSSLASITPNMSWANVLKKGSSELQSNNSSGYKPMARINPLPVTPVNEQQSGATTKTLPLQQTIVQREQQRIAGPSLENETLSSSAHNMSSDSTKHQTELTILNKYDDPTVFRMGEFLLNYQMDKQTVSLLPRGLTNRNNYCYINSILQALLACPPFYNLLMALPTTHSKGNCKYSSTPLIDNMIKFVHEFTPLSDSARSARKDRVHKRGDNSIVDIQSGMAFEPSYVYTMLKNTSAAGVFSVEGRQEDAEEFLSCLLNGINDEMLELIKLVNNEPNPAAAAETNINYNHAEEEWKVMGPKNKGSITRCTEFGRTPLSDIFRGQLRSRVSRMGEQPTDNVQPFFTLQLDIEKAETVTRALEILVGKDQLEGMTCSKTKQQIEAWKQVTLEELPVILILHLKWFDYKLNGCSKIFKKVEFPIDLKVDAKFLSPNIWKKLNSKQKQYKLFAVTYHVGKETTKGHYVTDAFHVGYGGWVRYDDNSLQGISENDVLNPAPPSVPYLLYYRRCDTIGNNQSNAGRTR
ncbi:ubiquitin carboxyl-terminal hydrolase 10 isoform X1 [Vespa crabro]|uniref:ubiquitin carboxyl-terminal hydrolase 10 isoform X1 n=2 Tax=Vespa crabro TaxID=7445 RepID=UPI001F020147|nr:ubiquitin carboxyl-terminal hydrolase 10 isoform X1 [Vespa crabro]